MRAPADVLAQLARGPAILSGVLADVPHVDLRRRPREGKWSAHEHACHLALMEPRWLERAEQIVREDRPTIVNYEPDADEPADRLLKMDLDDAVASYERGRRALVERLTPLPATAWAREAVHTGHVRYSLFLMCRHAALHDMLHVYRIEESVLGTHWPEERVG